MFQTRCVLPALVAVGSSFVEGVDVFSEERLSPAGVSEMVPEVCRSVMDAQLKEPISAGSFDNSPGKELPR